MTGLGHRLTGPGAAMISLAIATLLYWEGPMQVAAGAIALCSTRLPDTLEVSKKAGGIRIGTLIPHRTITHWAPAWIALAYWGVLQENLLGAGLLGASVGALIHLAGDAPNPMGVPWILPWKRARLGPHGLWRSGEHEILMVVGFTAVGFFSWSGALASQGVDLMHILLDIFGS